MAAPANTSKAAAKQAAPPKGKDAKGAA